MIDGINKLKAWLNCFFAPQPAIRLEFLRLFIPLAILLFLSSRLLHPADWLTNQGFQVPDLGHRDWRQPLYLAPLSLWVATLLCIVTTFSGLLVTLGFLTRLSSGIFAACLVYLTLADRMAAFTVSKLGAVLALALFLTPTGNAFSVDAWLRTKKTGLPSQKTTVSWGNVRFFQCLLLVMYFASGIAKIHGQWLENNHVLWTHLHDSYQTLCTYWIAKTLPYSAWTWLQYLVLTFESGALLWFILPYTRFYALIVGLGMHLFIGLCFGPVIWFALLMIILLIGCFAPIPKSRFS